MKTDHQKISDIKEKHPTLAENIIMGSCTYCPAQFKAFNSQIQKQFKALDPRSLNISCYKSKKVRFTYIYSTALRIPPSAALSLDKAAVQPRPQHTYSRM